jgi:hypothetical protein
MIDNGVENEGSSRRHARWAALMLAVTVALTGMVAVMTAPAATAATIDTTA